MPEQPGQEEQASCLIVIPARFASTRFPGKPLARLTGSGGIERSLIEWSWRAASAAGQGARLVVATDDRRIVDEVERFGGSAVMTPSDCANGTERCAAVLDELALAPKTVVNFQGDAPLTPPGIVAAVVQRLGDDPALAMATPAIACRGDTFRHLIADRDAGRVGGTTMVFDKAGRALYFSKSVIPHVAGDADPESSPVHLHLGVYAYRPEALAAYRAAPPSTLELVEGLEQLRFLDLGLAVGAVVCPPPGGATIELNNPGDAPLIEVELQRRGL